MNFATKMIPEVRARMNEEAIANSQPLPTDAEVKLEMDIVYASTKKDEGNFALRGPIMVLGQKMWWVEDVTFLTPAVPIIGYDGIIL